MCGGEGEEGDRAQEINAELIKGPKKKKAPVFENKRAYTLSWESHNYLLTDIFRLKMHLTKFDNFSLILKNQRKWKCLSRLLNNPWFSYILFSNISFCLSHHIFRRWTSKSTSHGNQSGGPSTTLANDLSWGQPKPKSVHFSKNTIYLLEHLPYSLFIDQITAAQWWLIK